MNKWQKISGCVIFGLGTVIELLLWAFAITDWEDTPWYSCISSLSCAMWINYLVTLRTVRLLVEEREASDETDLSGEMDNCSIVCDYVLLFFLLFFLREEPPKLIGVCWSQIYC